MLLSHNKCNRGWPVRLSLSRHTSAIGPGVLGAPLSFPQARSDHLVGLSHGDAMPSSVALIRCL